jgi:enolase
MEKIKNIHAREILDSRGNPTVECDVELDDGSFGRAAVPSGASTGVHEALELRDGDTNRYLGKGVKKAVQNINSMIKNEVVGKIYSNYQAFDKTLLDLDGTENKSNIGANATLAASLAFAKSLADHTSTTLYQHIAEDDNFLLPVPMMNIINGGSHADNDVDIQEFMIAPVGASSFSESLRFGCEIFHSLKSILKSKSLNTNVGDEGGFAPNVNSSAEVIEIILSAVEKAGLKINDDILLSLDVASTEFYQNNKYELKGEGQTLSSEEMASYIENLANNFPIYSIEDGMSEDDWDGWIDLTNRIGNKVQLVGDDLFVTNIKRLKTGIEKNAGNAILVKLNQIGTLSETIDAINLGKRNNFNSIISHRSGETEDTTIADLSVAVSAGQIKTGSLSRTDRTAKYNQLLRIEEMLGSSAKYAGKTILKH